MFTKGSLTIGRFDKFWSRLWSDLTMEQKLMRSAKTYDGMEGESPKVRWQGGQQEVFMVNICEELESFCSITCATGEQHVHMRPSRIIRDNSYVEKLKN